jgi:hypothetical protein
MAEFCCGCRFGLRTAGYALGEDAGFERAGSVLAVADRPFSIVTLNYGRDRV